MDRSSYWATTAKAVAEGNHLCPSPQSGDPVGFFFPAPLDIRGEVGFIFSAAIREVSIQAVFLESNTEGLEQNENMP